jgi:hypothetical protein
MRDNEIGQPEARPLRITRMSVAEMRNYKPVRPDAVFYVVNAFGMIIGPGGSVEQAKAMIARRRLSDDTLEWHIAESGALQDVMAYIEAQNDGRLLQQMAVSDSEVH